MSTDFTYNNKLINTSGPLKPTGKDQPLDARGRVTLYSDIESIPNPYLGMKVTVLEDENHNGEMFEYKVKGLKANSLGIANSVIDMDQLVPYAEFLGVSASGSSGEGLTIEQAQQLQTAYEHSQTTHAPSNAEQNVQSNWNETDTSSDAYILNKPTIPSVPSNIVTGSSSSYTIWTGTQAQFDVIPTKDNNTIYFIKEE